MKFMTVTPGFYDKMLEGDDRCPIKINQHVVKIAVENDREQPIGAKGIVTGNIYHEELGAAYLVKFENYPIAAFVVGWKIKEDD